MEKELYYDITIGWHATDMPVLKTLAPQLKKSLQVFASRVLENLKNMEMREYARVKKLRDDGVSFKERKTVLNKKRLAMIDSKRNEMINLKNKPEIKNPEEWAQHGDLEKIQRDIDMFVRINYEIIKL